MKCIVPLAGPDLWTQQYGLRPLVNVNGTPLIEAALRPRAWAAAMKPSDYIFVIRETTGYADLADYLRKTWPGSRSVTLSDVTGGALFSCLAAMALVPPDETVIIDLADIFFCEGPDDPEVLMTKEGYGAVVPVFVSNEACYSYLKIEDGFVTEAREKIVISANASAGVYMFRNSEVFLQAATHSIAHRSELAHKNKLFICPMINGVIAGGLKVIAPDVSDCQPVGKMFHL